MARLTVRDLPDDVHARLRARAAKAGHSMEEEARRILAEACSRKEPELSLAALRKWVDGLYAENRPQNVVDDLIEERRRQTERA